jgi:cbb3-type cytochrome oxidase subunit 1
MPAYNERVVRQFTIATVFWGIVGFLVGVYIALELAFPILNLDLEWTTFGRLRPLHTSAVIFAFGGNALAGLACSAAMVWPNSCSGVTNFSSFWRPSAMSPA